MKTTFKLNLSPIVILLLILFSPSFVMAESLCRGAGRSMELFISETSNCKKVVCLVKREAGGLYFELTPSDCSADGGDFRLSVKMKQPNIKPLLKCGGNAICQTTFGEDGTVTISQVQGKAWGRVFPQKSKQK
jgi:hypothetical protein